MKPLTQVSQRIRPNTGFPVSIRTSLAALLIFCGPWFPAFAQQPSAPLRRMRLDMVFSTSLFRAANRNDAIAAVRVWASMFGRTHGFQVDPTVEAVDNVAEVRKRVLAGSAGVLALDVVEYFELADLPGIEPALCAMRGEGSVPPRYLVLVGAESGIPSLQALRGKSIIIHANTGANLGQVWLDAMLYDGRLGRPDHFFRSVEVVPKASSAILPVFFGKADAAIVDDASFEVSKEMNPQVGAKLRVLSASPPLAEGLLCICRKQIEFRDKLLEDMRNLHLDPQGRQILMVFGFDRLAPVDTQELEQVRELWRKHNLLSKPPEQASFGSLSRQETHSAGRGEEP
ncbi:MAG: PhnD/SsuA/transferrin family substrate-binding protein [Terriglobia bacterium]|jgi:phosphonate transport system substrate-binding protein